MHILRRVERHLTATGMTPTRFGRLVAGDPRLVFDLRLGREPGPAMRSKVIAFIDGQRAEGR